MLLNHSVSAFVSPCQGTSRRLAAALERAYETPASRAAELRDALSTFVTQLRAVGAAPHEVAVALRRLVLHTAPSHRYWPAYGTLSEHLVRWGLEVYYEQV